MNKTPVALITVLIAFILSAPLLLQAAAPSACSTAMTANDTASLNEAIACFNAASGGAHVITLTGDVVLSADTTTITNPNSAKLTIDGQSQYAIDGAAQFRPITIDHTDVTITGLTVRNGSGEDGDNLAALRTPFGEPAQPFFTIDIDNSEFSNAQSSDGASLLVEYGYFVNIDSSIVKQNAGAGIEFSGGLTGTLTIRDSDIFENLNRGIAVIGASAVEIFDSNIHNNETALGGGGIILGSGLHKITNSTVANNQADGSGGGISIFKGNITITDSTVSGNSANGNGGGITSGSGGGTASVINSTVANNEATGSGGAIYASYGLILNNSTVSGNSSDMMGGGILIKRENLIITNSTITSNSAPNGAGIFNDFEHLPVQISNSIFANNSVGGDCETVAGGETVFNASLVGDGSCGVVAGTNDNLVGNPLLGPLQDNGGKTHTHALLTNSPAINSASSTDCLALDQRGLFRDDQCDMGAYEDGAVEAAFAVFLPVLIR